MRRTPELKTVRKFKLLWTRCTRCKAEVRFEWMWVHYPIGDRPIAVCQTCAPDKLLAIEWARTMRQRNPMPEKVPTAPPPVN